MSRESEARLQHVSDPETVRARTLAVRLAKQRARMAGRKAPTMHELTEQLGDEAGIDADARRREARKSIKS